MTEVITDLYPFYKFFLNIIYIDRSQQGFRDNKPTEMASQIFIENIQESMDK